MTPLTVLQVHTRYRQSGGEDAVTDAEATLLRDAGHTVVQFHAQNPHDVARSAMGLLASPWNPRSARRIAAVARRTKPDVAHIHNTWWALSPSVIASLDRAGIPTVVTLHNYRILCANAMLFRDGRPCEDCVGTHPWHAVQHRCYRSSALATIPSAATIGLQRVRSAWELADLLLPLTEFARQRFLAGGLPPDKLRVKPNFVADPGSRSMRPSESRVVVYIGRLSPEKGVGVLLQAWRKAEMAGFELVVAGDGPLGSQLRASAPPGVRFTGRLTSGEVRELILGARAMAFPSVCYESQPIVLLEALAAGLPLIASDIGGVPDTLRSRDAARLVQAGDVSGWTSALMQLADDEWVDRAGGAARRAYEAGYSPKQALDELVDVYRSAIRVRTRHS